ncbi:hypothetical protein ACSBR1_016084 [Camellia fascicularis]
MCLSFTSSFRMAKTVIDAVLGLSFDDSPSNLAAAALFYILTSDGQDDHLLDSPSCIRFMIKLLKPLTSGVTKDKTSTIGCCKEMKSSDGNDNAVRKPELSPKWIALLAMEKACLSTISLEDTSGTVRKTGGNFKEKLREFGGLDVVFEVARNCHSIMERWLDQSCFSYKKSKDNVDLESLVLLLKCLKIMENATFLSQDNQSHLLEMKGSFDHQGSPRSFTKLIISVIKILSGLSLSKSSLGNSDDDEFCNISNGADHASEMPLLAGHKVDSDEIISISSSSTEWTSSQKSFIISQNSQWLSAAHSVISKSTSEATSTSSADTCLLKIRVNSSTSGSCSGTSGSSCSGTPVNVNGSRMNFGLGKRCKVAEDTKFELLEDNPDPFAFHEDEFEPSKWELLSGRPGVTETGNSRATYRENEEGCQSQPMLSQQESSNRANHRSDVSCSSSIDEEKFNLLADCLLTAVKVLMNLTNDNPVGCQQMAACGGLETLSSLIAGHFPSFSLSLPPFSEIRENSLSMSSLEVDHQIKSYLSDQELDFLVAILGLLVNLVEKDGYNRSLLAAVSVSLPSVEGLEEGKHRDVIPLLCSIFLANQGAGEAVGEGKVLSWDDEAVVLQGEKEAEKMIVEAYAALLLAFLSTESKSIRNAIAECLPDHKLTILVPVLERFVEFHLALNMIQPETHTTVLEVIESCRMA